MTQVTGTGIPGTGVGQVSGAAGTQVTRTGTLGVGSGTGAGSSGEGTGIQDTGAGHSDGPSSMRVTSHTKQHEEIVPQDVTSRRRRPKWLQETLKEAKDVGEPERIMRWSKVPERF